MAWAVGPKENKKILLGKHCFPAMSSEHDWKGNILRETFASGVNYCLQSSEYREVRDNYVASWLGKLRNNVLETEIKARVQKKTFSNSQRNTLFASQEANFASLVMIPRLGKRTNIWGSSENPKSSRNNVPSLGTSLQLTAKRLNSKNSEWSSKMRACSANQLRMIRKAWVYEFRSRAPET